MALTTINNIFGTPVGVTSALYSRITVADASQRKL